MYIILTLTLVLQLDLDMVLIHQCAKKKVSIPSASKVKSPKGHRDTQTRQKHCLSTYVDDNNTKVIITLTSSGLKCLLAELDGWGELKNFLALLLRLLSSSPSLS